MLSRRLTHLCLVLLLANLGFTPLFSQSPEPFKHLVRIETWTEQWPDTSGVIETREVTAGLWTKAMQAVLDAEGELHIPARDEPYYLDGPLVMASGQTLRADPRAEIRLKPGTNTCLVRNRNPAGPNPEKDLRIEGGIWTTLATTPTESNGNLRGASSKLDPVHGTHGVLLMNHVRGVVIRDVTVRQSRAFAIHLANVNEFLVDGLTLENHRRDGVHVNGPARAGKIRRVKGNSHDDTVALNAWEWKNYAPSYGPIQDILVEEVTGAPDGMPSANSIRLLPGVKRFDDGSTLDCSISGVTLRGLTDILEIKCYDQPNLELGRDSDFSVGLGSLSRIRLEDLHFHRPGKIEIHAETDGFTIDGVTIDHPLAPDWHLVAIGPKSQTYRHGGENSPETWTEIFSPDLDCTVRHLTVTGVRERGAAADLSPDRVVRVIEQSLNPRYPATTPKGGKGKGIWVRD